MSDPNDTTGPIVFPEAAPEPLHPVTGVPTDEPTGPAVKTRAEMLADEQANLATQEARLTFLVQAEDDAKKARADSDAAHKAVVEQATAAVRAARAAVREREAIVRGLTPRTRKPATGQGTLDGAA
jgi:hypothetical protein